MSHFFFCRVDLRARSVGWHSNGNARLLTLKPRLAHNTRQRAMAHHPPKAKRVRSQFSVQFSDVSRCGTAQFVSPCHFRFHKEKHILLCLVSTQLFACSWHLVPTLTPVSPFHTHNSRAHKADLPRDRADRREIGEASDVYVVPWHPVTVA